MPENSANIKLSGQIDLIINCWVLGTRHMKLVIGTAIGLTLGLFLMLPCVIQHADQWLSYRPIGLTWQALNYPAIRAVKEWAYHGLPCPTGWFGEDGMVPYIIAAQWSVVGLLGGFLWKRLTISRGTQPAPGRVPSKAAADGGL